MMMKRTFPLISPAKSPAGGKPRERSMLANKVLSIVIAFMIIVMTSCAPRVTQPPPRPAKVALVLGAGASRGFAHIGVLKALETNGIPVHMIVGTSAGSFVGSLYAYGYNAFQLQKMSFSLEKGDIIDLTIPDNGFVKGERLEEYINKMLNHTPLEKLKIPFYAVATNIRNGEEVVFGRGNTGAAVRASCSIPGVFRPFRIGEQTYVDGGVVSPVPVEAARRLGADIIIAVDISAQSENAPPETTIDTLLQSITIMHSRLAGAQLSQAQVVIRPKVGHIGSSDFTKRHEAVLEGEKAVLDALPAIKGVLGGFSQRGRQ